MGRWGKGQITTTGANGSGAGTGTFQLDEGILARVRIPTNSALPNTSDVAIGLVAPDGGTAIPLVTFSNVTTPVNAVVELPTVDELGAATGNDRLPVVSGNFSVTIAQANAGVIDVWLYII